MRYAIPLLANRIAPRCTIAEGLLVIEVDDGRVCEQSLVNSPGTSWTELLGVLAAEKIGTLVCGGISREARQELQERGIAVLENVAATTQAVVKAICVGRLRPGFGFADQDPDAEQEDVSTGGSAVADSRAGVWDCLDCEDRVCLEGVGCPRLRDRPPVRQRRRTRRMLEAALDISSEQERLLCRLSELVYFGLEMGYRRLGVAFCWELLEPTRIVTRVLRRFFAVVPVGCKVSGAQATEEPLADPVAGEPAEGAGLAWRDVPCDPLGQARILNGADCDLNVAVGLCVGADCLFARASRAPVTTLLVKDRSLAHNPIGALYSDHYLNEALRAPLPA
jgi:uncharacterized metal-binding protein/predicted Fe-Mo cluster-binding NifX family protein